MSDYQAYLNTIQASFLLSGKWFLICMALFIPLAYFFPGKSTQPFVRRDMVADTMYWFLGPLVYNPIGMYLILFFLSSIYTPEVANRLGAEGLKPLSTLPVWLQAILILLATDILQYWMHRLFHRPILWRFHAVHHSTEHLDWLSAARFHPVNIILYSTMMSALVFLLGFSPAAYGMLFLFNVIYSPLVHANLNWTYGPFRYVLASPVFHRWHHTYMAEGGEKNFAPTFPFLDLMFGTFYMPKGVQPTVFGAEHDEIPTHLIGQLIYPFRRKKTASSQESPTAIADPSLRSG